MMHGQKNINLRH